MIMAAEQTLIYDPSNFVFPFGAHICVVDVDVLNARVGSFAAPDHRRMDRRTLRARRQRYASRGASRLLESTVASPLGQHRDGRERRSCPHRLLRHSRRPGFVGAGVECVFQAAGETVDELGDPLERVGFSAALSALEPS